jgi:hypothetical protein
MHYSSNLALLTTIALSVFLVVEGVLILPNHAYAASSCKTVHKEVVCKASPNEVCTHYGLNQVMCTNRNFQNMPSNS